MLVLYRVAVFLSAALLFLVEPLFARRVLPVLGGASAVWTTTQVFFQTVLLAGYGYAHVASTRLGVRRHARAHLLVIALPILVLPLGLPRGAAPPAASSPVPWILATMLVTVGPPFFALSAAGPLLQRWLAATSHPRARDPYFLYAAGNLGSMAALLAYPTMIEPALPLRAQEVVWSWLYGAFVVVTAACALFVRGEAPAPAAAPAERVPPRRIARWVALAFVPASLSLGATTHLTQDVASAPLLWILPLSIYLLTFVLAFAARSLAPHRAFVGAAPVALVLGVLAAASPIVTPAGMFLFVILAALFVVAMACHGELAQDRPPPAGLTAFYLWIALGGALGGVFCALIAPVVFRTVVEYSATLVVAAFVLPGRAPKEARPARVDAAMAVLVGLACGAAILAKRAGFLTDPGVLVIACAALAHAVLVSAPRPAYLGLALGAVLVAAHLRQVRADGVLLLDRSFYGALSVTERGGQRRLYHGATLHGVQAKAPEGRAEPLAYYGTESPIGQVFLHGPVRPDARIAVVGLGVGTLMAYAQPAQRWTFYEIDPLVAKIAQDPRWFSYLADARAPYDVVLGDARRSLSAATDRYDLIVLDAYSSDAVPIHLLTREAALMYLARLADGGLLALHVSNLHLDLARVVAGLAGALGLVCVEQNAAVSLSEEARGNRSSHWALLARRREDLGTLAGDPRWTAPAGRKVVWTDDAASPLQVLHTR